ncbi:MAG: OmpA family protein [Prevotellaceae bacterium]|nr:OmpA family protein [Prevotellaceae bacterium]
MLLLLSSQPYKSFGEPQPQAQDPAGVQVSAIQDVRYKSARNYHRAGLYSKALKEYREALQNNKNGSRYDSLVQRRIAECEFGLQKQSQPEPVTVTKLGITINDARYSNVGAFALNNEQTLYFTSPRPAVSTLKRKGKGEPSEMRDNVCVAHRSGTVSPWGVASVVPELEHVQLHQGVLGISPDGRDMFIFRGTNDIFVQNLDHMAHEVSPVSLAKALNLNIDKRFHVSSLAMTVDRQTIYLCTDDGKVNGGYGGYDIWSIRRDKSTGEWGAMVNLGAHINTVGHELSVSVLPDGKTIFFASDGYEGVGRCDIYRSTYIDAIGEWSKPLHLGYPINTPNDDLYYNPVFDNPKHAYYSVERPDEPGNYDIYFIDYQGDILTPEEKKARRKAADKEQIETTPIKAKEKALLVKQGYSDFPQGSVAVGMKVLLRDIQFSEGKATLSPKSYVHLEPLRRLMESQPRIRIKISGHTDNIGEKAANLKLSKERARSVANFLIGKGIAPTRLEVEGYGQNQPITTNKTKAGRALNRRVEFKVIK